MSEITLERYTDDQGMVPVRGFVNPAKLAQFTEVFTSEPGRIGLALQAIREGYSFPIAEGISTGDFPTLFGALVDRELMAAYKAVIPDWRAYVKTGKVPNFNVHQLHKVTGQDSILPQVAENGPYLETPSVTGSYSRQVFKFGRVFKISFESTINDFMGAFEDIGPRFQTAVLRTEARNATLAFVAATGPSPALFGAPIADVDGQNVTNVGVLPFTIQNLETTLRLMTDQTDANGEPIGVEGVHLVVPPALYLTARSVLTSTWKMQVDTAGGANAVAPTFLPLPTANVLADLPLQLHRNREMARIDTSGNGNGTWYLFADYNEGVAAQLDYLRGHEAPEICMKSSDKLTIAGGGMISPAEGDFATDGIAYRVRCIHGNCHADPRFVYAQVNV